MPKVAIIRWVDLGKREMQNYEPLQQMGDWQLLGIGSKRPDHDLKALTMPVVQPNSLDAQLLSVPGLKSVFKKTVGLEINNLNYIFGLEEYLKDIQIVDVAETFHLFCRQVANAKTKFNYKIVASVHENIPFAHENLGFRRAIKKEMLQHTDAYRTHSTMGKEALIVEGVPAERIHVLPTAGVDSERFKPEDKDVDWLNRLGLTFDDIVILAVGRLTWAKGIYDLIYAFKMLTIDTDVNKLPIKLVIIGDGEEYDSITTIIDRLQLADRTKLVKKVPYDAMPKIHNIADIFVLSSIATPKWQEQFGAVLAESMGCGRAVVGADSGSIPEVLGEAGLIYKANDFGALAACLKKLIMNGQLRQTMGKQGRERVLRLYNNQQIALNLKRLYESIL